MNDTDSTPRTVLVTGANSGIGLATALELARRGYHVVGSVRSADKAERVRAAAAEAGVDVETVELDVDDPVRCAAVIDEIRPWALVNNAGYAQSGAVEEVSDDEARDQLETLVISPVRLARLAAGGMRDAGGGVIVNVSSIVAEVSTPVMGWYQAAKRALEGVTDALRMELRRDGIRVVLVEPGMIETPIWDDTREELDRSERYGATYEAWQRITRVLQPVMASPESVAGTIAKALGSGHPRDRYLVGIDAQVLTRLARIAPTWLTDAATRALLRVR